MDVIVLDIKSIAGESKLADPYTAKIECLSYSHGVAMQITGDQSNTTRTSGKPNHQDFTITKYVDIATCKLIDACNQAKGLGTITVTVGRNDSGAVVPFITYAMDNTIVSSVSVGGGGGGKPQETVTFNYSRIVWTYTSQKEGVGKDGNDSATWSLATNKAV